MTPLSRHANRVPKATTRGLGALQPDLSFTYYIFDDSIHTDIVASIAPTGTQKEKKKGLRKTEKNTGTKKGKKCIKEKRGKTILSKKPHTGGDSTAASADTALLWGAGQAI